MKNIKKMQIRDAFICGVIEKAEADKDIVLISNDFGAPALDSFRENYPKQFINAGISEQNIISVAAGMANEGKKVFVYSIASFISARCFEQIKVDVCVHNTPVTIMSGGVGLAYAEDGPTHHALEDISLMRALAGIEVYSPADAIAAYEMAKKCVENPCPAYVRLEKGNMPVISEKLDVEGDGFRRESDKEELILVGTGYMTHRLLEVSKKLRAKGIANTVVDLYKVHPVSFEFRELLSDARKVVSIEEHTIHGGLGSIIAEELVEMDSPPMLKRFAIPAEKLYVYGSRGKLHSDFDLDSDSLVSAVSEWCE